MQRTYQTPVYERIDLGSAETASGLLKIVSALLVLYNWAEVTYRPWFEQHVCLVLTPEQEAAVVKAAAAAEDAAVARSLAEQERYVTRRRNTTNDMIPTVELACEAMMVMGFPHESGNISLFRRT